MKRQLKQCTFEGKVAILRKCPLEREVGATGAASPKATLCPNQHSRPINRSVHPCLDPSCAPRCPPNHRTQQDRHLRKRVPQSTLASHNPISVYVSESESGCHQLVYHHQERRDRFPTLGGGGRFLIRDLHRKGKSSARLSGGPDATAIPSARSSTGYWNRNGKRGATLPDARKSSASWRVTGGLPTLSTALRRRRQRRPVAEGSLSTSRGSQ